MDASDSTEPQVILLAHPDFRARERAANTLRLLGLPDALPELRAALKDPVACVRLAAMEAISHLADEASVPALCSEIGHASWQIRSELAEVLGRLRDIRAVPVLADLLRDSYPLVRARAAYALGRIGGIVAGSALAGAMGDADPYVAQVVAEALALGADPQQIHLRRALRAKTPAIRESAGRALVALGPAAIPALNEALTDYRPEIAIFAAQLIGDLGAPAVPALSQAALYGPIPVRRVALTALVRIREPASTEVFRTCVDAGEPSLQAIGLQGLSLVGDVADVARFCSALESGLEPLTVPAAVGLEAVVRTTPAAETRAALPLLERCARRHLSNPVHRQTFRRAIRAIEAATGDSKDLPRPVRDAGQEPDSLPRPAVPPRHTPSGLPIPAGLAAPASEFEL